MRRETNALNYDFALRERRPGVATLSGRIVIP